MELTTDFECGAGKRLERLGESHWRLEANGDPSGYDKYFCVRITAGAQEPRGLLRLEIHPDSELGEGGATFFTSHFPSNLWCTTGAWQSAWAIRNRWEDSVTFHDGSIEVRIPVEPGMQLTLATNAPLPYSELVAWVADLRSRHGDRLEVTSLGPSAEGRDIPVVRLRGSMPGLPKLLVLAGQHPSEHCGNWASRGIVEYCLSSIAEAREITGHFDLAVVPMINPDGNVHGLSGANAEGVNLFPDFPGPDGEPAPRATENRRLWEWIGREFPPDALLHFHGYMGWRVFSQHPYDGIYLLRDAETLYPDPKRLAAYRAIQDRLAFETPAYTATWGAGVLDDTSLEHHLAARFGTLSAFYEINSASVAPVEQYRRGPQVLSAVARALVRDAG